MVIKNLAFLNKQKLKTLNSFIEANIDISEFNVFFVDYIHNFLPLSIKFLDETFVSIEDKKIKGLITANKIGDKKIRIKRLLLDENSYSIGKALVNFVLSKYLLKGAEAFYAVVNKLNTPLISMFMEGCSFQNIASEFVYKIKDTSLDLKENNFEYIKRTKTEDAKKLEILAQNTIVSYKKPFFMKTLKEFKKEILKDDEKYIITDEKGTIGYFSIFKLNKSDFCLDFIIECGFEVYALDIVKFAKSKLLNKNSNCNLYVILKNYYKNFSELKRIFDIEYELTEESEILYKGFLTPQKQLLKYEKMVFNDITPAF